MKKLCLILSLSALLVPMGAWAQDFISTAFAPIEYGARAIGMGGAFGAVSDEPVGVMYNPAGLGYMTKRQASAQYADLFGLGVHNSFVAYGQPDRGSGAAGITLTNMSLTIKPSKSADVQEDKTYSETLISYTFAKRMGRITSIGATLKGMMVRSDFKDVDAGLNGNAGGGGFDVGVVIRPFADVAFGFSARDAYTNLRWDGGKTQKLPIQFRWSLAAMPVAVPGLVAGVDISGDDDVPAYKFAMGGEYTIREIVSLRAGLTRILPDEESRNIPSFGFGVLFYSIQFNFAYRDDSVLGSTSYFDVKLLIK